MDNIESSLNNIFEVKSEAAQVKAPSKYKLEPLKHMIFLAGSIEMGKAEPWQDKLVKLFQDDKNVLFLNPRRDDWDESWKQEIENKQFREQVEWELQAMEDADIIVMYFDPNTKSPITLLELGLHAKGTKPLIVCCPTGFWRKGNVDIVCKFYKNATVVENFDELVKVLKSNI